DRHETPEVLVADRTLSAAQKLARLEAWEEDLKAGRRAAAKGHGLPGAVAEC
ncbi:MAG: hypothetical protein QG601_1702, partial [Pseudomonadota bacterium]|nr:hypothetical protein [Pseudomonadota bacterium]